MEQVAVMQNIFYNRKITRIFDLKGSLRGRFAAHMRSSTKDEATDTPSHASEASSSQKGRNFSGSDRSGRGVDRSGANDGKEKDGSSVPESGPATLLDGDFLEFTLGRPMPMTDSAKAVFQMSILNVSHFGTNGILIHLQRRFTFSNSLNRYAKRRILYSCPLSMFWTIQFWWEWMKRTWSLSWASLTLCGSTIF
jgi:hypothetical protein